MNGQTEIIWGEVADLVENSVLDWKEVKVEDIKADFAHALSTGPFGSAISSKYFLESGFPVIRGANLSQNVSERFSDDDLVFISPEKAQEFRRSIVRKGDLIFTCWGTINQVGLIDGKSKYEEYVISNKQMKLTPDPEKADPYFLYYLFSSPDYQSRILNNDIGSSVPGFNLGQLKNMELLLPSISEQRVIASVLSSLDDKIDLLHRQNATLEALAETLFRQWFVEEAKEEWEVKTVGEVLQTVLGGTPATGKPEYWNGTIPWINSGEVNNFRILSGSKFITELGMKKSNTKLLPKGTTVVAITGATLGQISLLEIETCANQSVVGIIPNTILPKEFVFLWIKHKLKEIILSETGGAQPHINKNDINECQIVIPAAEFLTEKMTVIRPAFEKITSNVFLIQTLSALRDTLLPKLMSGEVRVKLK
ncbi:restriction endonuclease subunit S [Hymenobacter coalescens]